MTDSDIKNFVRTISLSKAELYEYLNLPGSVEKTIPRMINEIFNAPKPYIFGQLYVHKAAWEAIKAALMRCIDTFHKAKINHEHFRIVYNDCINQQ